MKAQLREVSYGFKQTSFNARNYTAQDDYTPHYHNELELIHISSGSGTFCVGDSTLAFKPGDTILLGPFLAHHLKFDITRNTQQIPVVTILHFSENLLGSNFLDLSENIRLKELIISAKKGIRMDGGSKNQMGTLVKSTINAVGTRKTILLLEILFQFSQSAYQVLSSAGTAQSTPSPKSQIDAIYRYSLKNFRESITIEQLADIANISPRSFCRFFKSKTQKTYTQFLNEIRINHACKLLLENQYNVKQVCFESGFHNFVSFHKHFKIMTGRSPLQYQNELLSSHKTCA